MSPKHPTTLLRTLPAHIEPESKRDSNDKLEVTNTDGAIDQTVRAKDLSAHEFDFMTYAEIDKRVWGDTCQEVVLFIQGLRSYSTLRPHRLKRPVGRRAHLKLMDDMYWHATVSTQCDFYSTNDLGFKSTGSLEVVQLAELV